MANRPVERVAWLSASASGAAGSLRAVSRRGRRVARAVGAVGAVGAMGGGGAAVATSVALLVWLAAALADSELPVDAPVGLSRLPDGQVPPECQTKLCVPKCCPLGQTYKFTEKGRKKTCVPTDSPFDPFVAHNYTDGTNLTSWSADDFFVLVGDPCVARGFKSYAYDFEETEFWDSGLLNAFDSLNSNSSILLQMDIFCMEYTTEEDRTTHVCDIPKNKISLGGGFTNWLYTFGLLISVSCLILTLIVYLMVESLRDLHGKSLVCHVGSLAIAYIMLASVQLSGESGFGKEACRRIAFIIQFFLLSSFLWLHVMCVDSLWAVMGATGHSPVAYPRALKWTFCVGTKQWITGLDDEVDAKKQAEKKKKEKELERRVFVAYFFYATILSLVPVVLFLKTGLSPTIPSTYLDHNMKLHKCELDTNTSWAYFYPIPAVATMVNFGVFIFILVLCVPFRWNTSGPQRVPKQKARMCFFLFILMSSNWLIDIISWALKGKQFTWVMLHAFYILQGLVTFFIFVWEDRVRDRIIHKLLPRMRQVGKRLRLCKEPTRKEEEEEATALRDTRTCANRPAGWVVPK